MDFLGLEWDSVRMEVRLPELKHSALIALLHEFVGRRWTTVRNVQKFAGKLGFAAQVVRGEWTHLRRIWDSYKGSKGRAPHKLIRVSKSFLSDLEFWIKFLPLWNGISTITLPSSETFSSDACREGYGAMWNFRWIAGAWSLRTRDFRYSNWKELVAILLAIRAWGYMWRNCRIRVLSDNAAAVRMINKGYSPHREYMRIVRKMFWLAVEGDFELVAEWLPGTSNSNADALSRWLTNPLVFRSGESGLPTELVLPGSQESLNAKDL